MSLTERIK